METEEDENINKPRQIDNLTQQATCDEVRPFKCSYCDRHFTKLRKPFVDNMNWFTMERNPTSEGIVISGFN